MQKAGAGAFGAARSSIKALKESVNSVNSKTGLPPRLLELFQPRPSLPTGAEIKKRKPKLPYTGLADLVQHFAAPGDAEYEPEPPSNRPQEPRLCANPELPSQARLDSETKAEKKIRITQWKKEEVSWAGMHGTPNYRYTGIACMRLPTLHPFSMSRRLRLRLMPPSSCGNRARTRGFRYMMQLLTWSEPG